MKNRAFKVSEFMRVSPTTVHPSVTVREVVELMIRERTNGLIIVDDEKHVKGILSSWDIIEHIVPDYLELDKHLASFEAGSTFVARVKEVENDTVSEFMTTKVHTIDPDATIMEAATLLSEFKIRQLPVVSKDGVLVGYINRTDIKLAVGEALDVVIPK